MADRANIFGKSQIILGDMTSHGGVVISGSSTSDWHGIPIARKGDRVYCPQCPPHTFVIAEGLEHCTDHGLPWALEGHKTTCGAVLMAQTAPVSADAALALSEGIAAPAQMTDSMPAEDKVYAIRFQALDPVTGMPSPACDYLLTRASGAQHSGTADQDGFTEVIETTRPEQVKVHFMFKSPKGDSMTREDLAA
ncbi:MAG: PAAR domain-containing protein [Burkholderiaceae bacterium]|jgi:uncharacterized Zn-binding protein involved in type VI secretion|nr:PAAR domain-containing protein [Burkholderiaceae bacterium]